MKYIIILCIIIAIYYQIYKRYPEYLESKHHFYFTTFIVSYILFYYFMSYQKTFVYNVFKNVKDIDERPLYDLNSIVYKQNQMDGLRYNLAMRQGWRCLHCHNPILQKDIYDYKIHYIKPLQFGGENNINNLGIKCKTCSEFSPY
jgi:hypothetical protein